MKLLPIPLPPLGAPPSVGMWNSDLFWRYQAPQSPLAELKTQLPSQLSPDPRLWRREDVAIFLQFCEREFDLPKFDLELFQMNGKALSLLTKKDLAERIPGAGDVLHNVIQMLMRESQLVHKHLPSSPITPTSRYPFSPLSQPPTPNWSVLGPPDSPFHAAHFQQLMQSNSVTLSPAPSIDSQGQSPPQHQEASNLHVGFGHSLSSNQSDSDDDSYSDKQSVTQEQQQSPPGTPSSKDAPLSLSQQITNVVNSWSVKKENSGSSSAPSTPGAFAPIKREFFPDAPEPNTNGRLLWDFLQQLLNDTAQRYNNFITWKCRDTGVFKIVDPAGLAKLWGIQKNHLSMNYDKMSRALRYYYRVNILRKVQGERHCYQFLRNPTELKSIKNISLLRQQSHQPSLPQSSSTGLNQNTLLKQHQFENPRHNIMQHHQLVPPKHAQQQQLSIPTSANTQMQHLPHLPLFISQPQQQQQQHHDQNPPSSPRVHALNGAFHQLSTSSPVHAEPLRAQTSYQPSSSSNLQSQFKMEPNIDNDELPTDLSTNNTDKKFDGDGYPLIQNLNGLTPANIVCGNNDIPVYKEIPNLHEQRLDRSKEQECQVHPASVLQEKGHSTHIQNYASSVEHVENHNAVATDLRKLT